MGISVAVYFCISFFQRVCDWDFFEKKHWWSNMKAQKVGNGMGSLWLGCTWQPPCAFDGKFSIFCRLEPNPQ